eukprot:13798008-Alexandrium_andersonii.AAC.1
MCIRDSSSCPPPLRVEREGGEPRGTTAPTGSLRGAHKRESGGRYTPRSSLPSCLGRGQFTVMPRTRAVYRHATDAG